MRRTVMVLGMLCLVFLAWSQGRATAQAHLLGRPAPEIGGGPWLHSPPLTHLDAVRHPLLADRGAGGQAGGGPVPSHRRRCVPGTRRDDSSPPRRREMTRKEFDLLRFLGKHPGEVLTRDRLLDEVWSYAQFPTTRTVDTHILRLRQKFEVDPEHPRYIMTVHGQGYKLASPDAAQPLRRIRPGALTTRVSFEPTLFAGCVRE